MPLHSSCVFILKTSANTNVYWRNGRMSKEMGLDSYFLEWEVSGQMKDVGMAMKDVKEEQCLHAKQCDEVWRLAT